MYRYSQINSIFYYIVLYTSSYLPDDVIESFFRVRVDPTPGIRIRVRVPSLRYEVPFDDVRHLARPILVEARRKSYTSYYYIIIIHKRYGFSRFRMIYKRNCNIIQYCLVTQQVWVAQVIRTSRSGREQLFRVAGQPELDGRSRVRVVQLIDHGSHVPVQ